jgi:predicted O-linked N-acetylglucosamine transferase (SPINDLY family)
LPAEGFIFYCFNRTFKLTPATFAGWMRILQQVEGSVLWLSEAEAVTAANLRQAARQAGVDPDRLVFAARMPSMAEHLARQRAADLFLDTMPFNAHTTASDALRAGLPVLTCAGESLASRVAASLLFAVGLPELISSSQAEYEALAIHLATDPAAIGSLRRKLAQNLPTAPLFDTPRYARALESAFELIHRRVCAGLPAEHVMVRP